MLRRRSPRSRSAKSTSFSTCCPSRRGSRRSALSIPAADFSYIQFNAHKSEMADPRVPLAMNLAVDKETLAKSIYLGHGKPNDAQHLVGRHARLQPEPQAVPLRSRPSRGSCSRMPATAMDSR